MNAGLGTMLQRSRDLLRFRTAAYRRVFDQDSRDVRTVLSDLAVFCRAHESTVQVDARASAVAEGRREVWLRIQQHLQLNDEELWALYDGRQGTT